MHPQPNIKKDLDSQIMDLIIKCTSALDWKDPPMTISCIDKDSGVYSKQAVEGAMAYFQRQGYRMSMSTQNMHFMLKIESKKNHDIDRIEILPLKKKKTVKSVTE